MGSTNRIDLHGMLANALMLLAFFAAGAFLGRFLALPWPAGGILTALLALRSGVVVDAARNTELEPVARIESSGLEGHRHTFRPSHA